VGWKEVTDGTVEAWSDVVTGAPGEIKPLEVVKGGTGKGIWTEKSIPYLKKPREFDEISIGTAGQLLKVTTDGTGYEWGIAEHNILSIEHTDTLLESSIIGDLLTRDATKWRRLAGNTSTTRKFFTQQGDGTQSAVPIWKVIENSDLPSPISVGEVIANNITASQNMHVKKTFKKEGLSLIWSYKKAITIDATKISGTHTNFPVLISLASDTDLATHAQDDGDDILFTDTNNVKLAHEIEKFVKSTGELVAWVKIPSISSTANTIIYMHYGCADAPNQQNPAGVWSNGYSGVWHLNETTGTVIKDSTGVNNGTPYNVTLDVAGKINGGDEFNGTTAYTDIPDHASLEPGEMTISRWCYVPSLGAVRNAINKHHVGTASGYALGLVDDNRFTFQAGNGTTWPAFSVFSAPISATGTWYYVVGVHTTTSHKIYVNAAETIVTTSGNIAPNTQPLWFSRDVNTPTNYYPGHLDEVRISSVPRSADWITTEYNNQNSPSTFYSVGTQTTSDYAITGENAIFSAGNDNKVGFNTSTPHSICHIDGSMALPIKTVTGHYTVTIEDYTILVDATGGAVTINLLTAVGIKGRIYKIKKIDSSANAVTVDPAGTETIDGAATASLTSQWQKIGIQSDNANWQII